MSGEESFTGKVQFEVHPAQAYGLWRLFLIKLSLSLSLSPPRQRVTRDRPDQRKEEPIVKEYIDTRKDKMYRDYMEPYICSASRPEKVLKLLREEGGVYRGVKGGEGALWLQQLVPLCLRHWRL